MQSGVVRRKTAASGSCLVVGRPTTPILPISGSAAAPLLPIIPHPPHHSPSSLSIAITYGDGIVEPEEWTKQCPCFDVQEEYKDLVKTIVDLRKYDDEKRIVTKIHFEISARSDIVGSVSRLKAPKTSLLVRFAKLT